eukprot:gb/GECG01016535.1/.p1 GENE.gb/GECG01016535.1/~~gb/GECG01016535.1/.p1  ORF type:complete len:2626 (+),score=273.17 gb/GECG01016535.1/:1-7878(+)
MSRKDAKKDKKYPKNLYFYSYQRLYSYIEELGVERGIQDTLFNEVIRDEEFRRRTCLLFDQFKPAKDGSIPDKLENPIRNEQVTITEEVRSLLHDASAILKHEGTALDYHKIFEMWCIMQEHESEENSREHIQMLWETYYKERMALMRFVQDLYRMDNSNRTLGTTPVTTLLHQLENTTKPTDGDSLTQRCMSILSRYQHQMYPSPLQLKSIKTGKDPSVPSHRWTKSVELFEVHARDWSQQMITEELSILDLLVVASYDRVTCSIDDYEQVLQTLDSEFMFDIPPSQVSMIPERIAQRIRNRFESTCYLLLLSTMRLFVSMSGPSGETHPLLAMEEKNQLPSFHKRLCRFHSASRSFILTMSWFSLLSLEGEGTDRPETTFDVQECADVCLFMSSSLLPDLSLLFTGDFEGIEEQLRLTQDLYSCDSLRQLSAYEPDVEPASDDEYMRLVEVPEIVPVNPDAEDVHRIVEEVMLACILCRKERGILGENDVNVFARFYQTIGIRFPSCVSGVDELEDDPVQYLISVLAEHYPAKGGEALNCILSTLLLSQDGVNRVVEILDSAWQTNTWYLLLEQVASSTLNSRGATGEMEYVTLSYLSSIADLFSKMVRRRPTYFFEIARQVSERHDASQEVLHNSCVGLCSLWLSTAYNSLCLLGQLKQDHPFYSLLEEVSLNSLKAVAATSIADRDACYVAARSSTFTGERGTAPLCLLDHLQEVSLDPCIAIHVLDVAIAVLDQADGLNSMAVSLAFALATWTVQLLRALLSRDLIVDVYQAFQVFDVNADGELSSIELRNGLKRCDIPLEEDVFRSLIQEIDSDQSDVIEFDEFVRFAQEILFASKLSRPHFSEMQSLFKEIVGRSADARTRDSLMLYKITQVITHLFVAYSSIQPTVDCPKAYICWSIDALCLDGMNLLLRDRLNDDGSLSELWSSTNSVDLLEDFFRRSEFQNAVVSNTSLLPASLHFHSTNSEKAGLIPLRPVASQSISGRSTQLLALLACRSLQFLELAMLGSTERLPKSNHLRHIDSGIVTIPERKLVLFTLGTIVSPTNHSRSPYENQIVLHPVRSWRQMATSAADSPTTSQSTHCFLSFVGAMAHSSLLENEEHAIPWNVPLQDRSRLHRLAMSLLSHLCQTSFAATVERRMQPLRDDSNKKCIRQLTERIFEEMHPSDTEAFFKDVFSCYPGSSSASKLLNRFDFTRSFIASRPLDGSLTYLAAEGYSQGGIAAILRSIPSIISSSRNNNWKDICLALSTILLLWDLACMDNSTANDILDEYRSSDVLWDGINSIPHSSLGETPFVPQSLEEIDSIIDGNKSFSSNDVTQYCFQVDAAAMSLQLLAKQLNAVERTTLPTYLKSIGNTLRNVEHVVGVENADYDKAYNIYSQCLREAGVSSAHRIQIPSAKSLKALQQLHRVLNVGHCYVHENALLSGFDFHEYSSDWSYGEAFEIDVYRLVECFDASVSWTDNRRGDSFEQLEVENNKFNLRRRLRALWAATAFNCISSLCTCRYSLAKSWSSLISLCYSSPRFISIAPPPLSVADFSLSKLMGCYPNSHRRCLCSKFFAKAFLASLQAYKRDCTAKPPETVERWSTMLDDLIEVLERVWTVTAKNHSNTVQALVEGYDVSFFRLSVQTKNLLLCAALILVQQMQPHPSVGDRECSSYMVDVLQRLLPYARKQLESDYPVCIDKAVASLSRSQSKDGLGKDSSVCQERGISARHLNDLYCTSIVIFGEVCATLPASEASAALLEGDVFSVLSLTVQRASKRCASAFQQVGSSTHQDRRSSSSAKHDVAEGPFRLHLEETISSAVAVFADQLRSVANMCLSLSGEASSCVAMIEGGLVNSLFFNPLWAFMNAQLYRRMDANACGRLISAHAFSQVTNSFNSSVDEEKMFDPALQVYGYGLGPTNNRGYTADDRPDSLHDTWCLVLRAAGMMQSALFSEACQNRVTSVTFADGEQEQIADSPSLNSASIEEKPFSKFAEWIQDIVTDFVMTHFQVFLSCLQCRILTLRGIQELEYCIGVLRRLFTLMGKDETLVGTLRRSYLNETESSLWTLVEECEVICRDFSLMLGTTESADRYDDPASRNVPVLDGGAVQRSDMRYYYGMRVYSVASEEKELERKLVEDASGSSQSEIVKAFFGVKELVHSSKTEAILRECRKAGAASGQKSFGSYFDWAIQLHLVSCTTEAVTICSLFSKLPPTVNSAALDTTEQRRREAKSLSSSTVVTTVSSAPTVSSTQRLANVLRRVNGHRRILMKDGQSQTEQVRALRMLSFRLKFMLLRKSEMDGTLFESGVLCGDSEEESELCFFKSTAVVNEELSDITLLKYAPSIGNLLCILRFCTNVVYLIGTESPPTLLQVCAQRALTLLFVAVDRYVRWYDLTPKDASGLLFYLLPIIGDDGVGKETVSLSDQEYAPNLVSEERQTSPSRERSISMSRDRRQSVSPGRRTTTVYEPLEGSTAAFPSLFAEDGLMFRTHARGMSPPSMSSPHQRTYHTQHSIARSHATSHASTKFFFAGKFISKSKCEDWKKTTDTLKRATGDSAFCAFLVRYMMEGLRWRLIEVDELPRFLHVSPESSSEEPEYSTLSKDCTETEMPSVEEELVEPMAHETFYGDTQPLRRSELSVS